MVKKLILVAIVAFAVTACGKKELSVSYGTAPLPQAQSVKAEEVIANGRSLTAFCWNGLQFITSWQASTPITQVMGPDGKPMKCVDQTSK